MIRITPGSSAQYGWFLRLGVGMEIKTWAGEKGDRRRRLATASFLLGLLGCVLVGVGPLLAIILGTIALRSGKREEGVKGGFDPAKWGILFGVLMLLVNAVVIYLFLR